MPKPSTRATSTSDMGGGAVGAAATESVPPKRRRTFTAGYKLRIVQEASSCTGRGETEALLRREGLYSSHLSTWRKQLHAHGSEGMASRRRGRKRTRDAKDERITELEKRNAKLERELHITHVLLELQKKASEVLGIALAPLQNGGES